MPKRSGSKSCPHVGRCGGCSLQRTPYDDQLKLKEAKVRQALNGLPVDRFHPILPSPEIYFYRNKMEFSFGNERDVEILEGLKTNTVVPTPVVIPGIVIPAKAGVQAVNTGLDPGFRRDDVPGGDNVTTDAAKPRKGGSQAGVHGLASPLPRHENPSAVHLGLHPKGRYALVTPTPRCRLLSPESQEILRIVSDWATRRQIPTYLRKDNSGTLRHLVIREGKNTGDRMVNLFSTSRLDSAEDLAHELEFSGIPITTFLWTVHDGVSDVARGEPRKIFWGEGFIYERVGTLRMKVGPMSFLQTNIHAAEAMLGILSGWVDENSRGTSDVLLDLYCGSGSIGLNLADRFANVVGIELEKSAVNEAVVNAETNGIRNASFYEGRLEEMAAVIPGLVTPAQAGVKDPVTPAQAGVQSGVHGLAPGLRRGDVPDFGVLPAQAGSQDVNTGLDLRLRGEDGILRDVGVIVDPPRAGLHAKVTEALLAFGAPSLYYVSCNPDSLARDLRLLQAKYRIIDVKPMDFFPHTEHVETAVRMRLINQEFES
ncbi:MAG: methyltransferase domain-containing protein [Elusimicrobia bacterium]|nr:methyltransferase domain-containing protein [Candidatus Obscuribacterium magneticum]